MIHYSVTDGVAVLRLDAPPVNALDFQVLEDLRELIERAAADPDVRAVVITGRPDHFSAGADVGMFRALDSRQEAVDGSKVFQETFGEVEDCPKPVVAAVAGRTMGGALELAMACHFRLAAEGSRFAMPEVHLGIVPGCGGTQRLPRLVGTEAALGMLCPPNWASTRRPHGQRTTTAAMKRVAAAPEMRGRLSPKIVVGSMIFNSPYSWPRSGRIRLTCKIRAGTLSTIL